MLPRNVLRAAILVYGYPLAGAVLAAICAYAAGLSDLLAAAAALLGLAAGMLLARARLRNERCLRDFMPMVVQKLPTARS